MSHPRKPVTDKAALKKREEDIAKEYEKLVMDDHPDIRTALAHKFHISKPRLGHILNSLRKQGRILKLRDYRRGQDKDVLDKSDPTKQHVETGIGKDGLYAESSGPTIKDLRGLIEACDVDMQLWDVDTFKARSWTTPVKIRTGGKDTLHHVTNYGVSASFKLKNVREHIATLFSEMCEKLGNKAKTRNEKLIERRPHQYSGGHLLELGIYDFHLGMQAWANAGKEDWDTTIAEIVFQTAIKDLVKRTQLSGLKIERVVMPIGNDFIHADNKLHTTTAGTQMHMDARYQKVFMLGVELQTWAIDYLLRVFKCPVDVVIVPGNHDSNTSFFLGELLKAQYRGHANVKIDNAARMRKYYAYGKTLLGFTHGNHEKLMELPMIMASEAPVAWGQSKWREFHIGHFHHRKAMQLAPYYQDTNGCLVRILPTLTAQDDYHSRQGYVCATKAAEAYIYSKHDGLVSTVHAQRTLEYGTEDN